MVVAHNRDKFNCRACKYNRHCDDSNPAPFPMFAVEDIGLESRTCLLPMISEDSRALMQLYTHYKNGFMPYGGGVYDQPAVFGEAMALIESRAQKMKAD